MRHVCLSPGSAARIERGQGLAAAAAGWRVEARAARAGVPLAPAHSAASADGRRDSPPNICQRSPAGRLRRGGRHAAIMRRPRPRGARLVGLPQGEGERRGGAVAHDQLCARDRQVAGVQHQGADARRDRLGCQLRRRGGAHTGVRASVCAGVRVAPSGVWVWVCVGGRPGGSQGAAPGHSPRPRCAQSRCPARSAAPPRVCLPSCSESCGRAAAAPWPDARRRPTRPRCARPSAGVKACCCASQHGIAI